MNYQSRRAFPRIHQQAPMKYAVSDTNRFHDSRILNSSKGGLYFEADQPLDPESNVVIIMVNYSRNAYGAEAFRSYVTQVRWCREISQEAHSTYGAGVQIVEKSHDIIAYEAPDLNQACDMCGAFVPGDSLVCTDSSIFLCNHCDKHLDAFPAGILKDNIERFLLGNVM